MKDKSNTHGLFSSTVNLQFIFTLPEAGSEEDKSWLPKYLYANDWPISIMDEDPLFLF